MTKGWTLYDPRLAWMLVAPALLLLLLFLLLPIAVMAVYTFFTFVTAGVETSALTLASGSIMKPSVNCMPISSGFIRSNNGP